MQVGGERSPDLGDGGGRGRLAVRSDALGLTGGNTRDSRPRRLAGLRQAHVSHIALGSQSERTLTSIGITPTNSDVQIRLYSGRFEEYM